MRSRVIPGSSPTMERRCPMIALNRVDLPTFGRPTITTEGREDTYPYHRLDRPLSRRTRHHFFIMSGGASGEMTRDGRTSQWDHSGLTGQAFSRRRLAQPQMTISEAFSVVNTAIREPGPATIASSG